LPQNQVARFGVMAAVSTPSSGLKWWAALLDAVPFDDLPNSVIRLLPRIYWNLRGLPQVPEWNRIRGAYKLNWARNAQLQMAYQEMSLGLHLASIPFQVLKGVAVSATTGLVGARVMGDIDLIVHTGHVKQTRRTLEALGYSLRDSATPSSIHGAGAYFDGKQNIIDVHTWEDKPIWLSQHPCDSVTHKWKESVVPTFPAEILAAHALGHGSMSTAESDISQALVDFSDLRRFCGSQELLDVISQSANEINFEKILLEIRECRIASETFLESAHWLSGRKSLKRDRASIKWFLKKLMLLPATLWRRRLGPRELILLARLTIKQPGLLLYFVWSALGGLQLVERVIRRLGGNLATPKSLFESGGPLPYRDFRQVVPRPEQDGDEFSVLVSISENPVGAVHPQSFALAIDGKSFGYFPVDSSNVGRYLVRSQLPKVEVALRQTSREKKTPIAGLRVDIVPKPPRLGPGESTH
jgi:hypothetical protein